MITRSKRRSNNTIISTCVNLRSNSDLADKISNNGEFNDADTNIDILNRLSSLESTLTNLSTENVNLKYKYTRLLRKVTALEKYNGEVDKSLTSLEKELSRLAQYGRRESIAILNIPTTVSIKDLEDKVIEILRNIGVVIERKDIVAVHRLKDFKNGNPPSTIVRFVNRKHAFQSLINKNGIQKSVYC